MNAPALMTCKRMMCSACGVYAAVRRAAPKSDRYGDVYAVTDWCAICHANSAYARSAT